MPPENFEKYQQFLAERSKENSATHMSSENLSISHENTADGERLSLVAVILLLIAVEFVLVFAIPYASGLIPMIMVVFAVIMLLMIGKLSKSPR